ncbi:DUF6531 domain-containing protein [Porticoccus sp. W117]|uniref:DUF6531 domain-containing protein n=1 Tax=Porticoccus sp. W117 TaxID=3054777 RepID=UPI0025980CE5|nr:DUF6531 domain-containing protein [Porticoccus sp. W117]MDM3871793.1 DUF6531 domain-containing protein [Porticoccus sp. W117]
MKNNTWKAGLLVLLFVTASIVYAECGVKYRWNGSLFGPGYAASSAEAIQVSCANAMQSAIGSGDWTNCGGLTCSSTGSSISPKTYRISGKNYAGFTASVSGEAEFSCDHVATGDTGIQLTYLVGVGSDLAGLDCRDDDHAGPSCDSVGNPINFAGGNKFQEEVDFSWNALQIARYYNSAYGEWSHKNFSRLEHSLEAGVGASGYFVAKVVDETGRIHRFYRKSVSDNFTQIWGYSGTLTENSDNTYTYTDLNGNVKTFSVEGKIISFKNRGGAIDLSYSYLANSTVISDQYGNNWTYNLNNELVSSVDFNGANVVSYSHDANGRLVSVTYPGNNTTRTYHYEDANYPDALTGITDENNVRFATWGYDSEGRAISSEHHGSAEKVTLDYAYMDHPSDPRVTTTNALGKQTAYHFTTIGGVRKVAQVEGHQSTHCAAANQSYTYDSRGFLLTTTDWSGNLSLYIRNSKGQVISHTDALNTPEQITVNTDWHSTFNLPTAIHQSYRQTDFTYDTNGSLENKQITITSTQIDPFQKYTESMLIVDADAESLAGWNPEVGTFQLWDYGWGQTLSHTGKSIGPNSPGASRLSQQIDVLADGVPVAEIDSGRVTAKLTWWHRSWDGVNNDPARTWFRFLGASQNLISETIPAFTTAPNQMTMTEIEDPMPANTRFIEIVIEGQHVAGSGVSYWVDDFEGSYEWYAE